MPSRKAAIYFPAFGEATGRKPHYRPVVSYSIPQGPIYLATAVRRLGWKAKVVDGNFSADPVAELLETRPDKVLISSSTPALQDAVATFRELRAAGFAGEVYLGGSHASLNLGARDWLLPQLDGLQWVSTLHEGSLFDWIPQVFPGRGEAEVLGPCSENSDEARAVRNSNLRRGRLFPEFVPELGLVREIYGLGEDWTAIHRSGARVGLGMSLITALGCTEGCTFCANPFMYELSFLSPWALEDALAQLNRMGVKHVGLTDMYFLMNPRHSRKVGESLRRHGITFSIQTCLESLSEAVLDELVEQGCESMLIGIENPVSPTLTKRVELDGVTWLLSKAVAERRIRVKLSYIVGLPGADFVSDVLLLKHIRDSVLSRGRATDLIQCNIYTPYRPDPSLLYAPYAEGARQEDGLEFILDKLPFRFWGIFPVSLSRPGDFTNRMMLCDLVSIKIFPRWNSIYLSLRERFCRVLHGAYPSLSRHLPAMDESLREYDRILGQGGTRSLLEPEFAALPGPGH